MARAKAKALSMSNEDWEKIKAVARRKRMSVSKYIHRILSLALIHEDVWLEGTESPGGYRAAAVAYQAGAAVARQWKSAGVDADVFVGAADLLEAHDAWKKQALAEGALGIEGETLTAFQNGAVSVWNEK